MVVLHRCGAPSAALLLGLASASSVRGEEPARAPQAIATEPQQVQVLETPIKSERRKQLSSTQKLLAGKARRRPGERVRPALLPARWDISLSLDNRNTIAPWPEAKRNVVRPNSTARTSVEWAQPYGVMWGRGQWSQHVVINSNVVAPDVKLDISGTRLDVAREANAQVSELSFVQPKNRERNQVDDLKLKFSTLSDVVQFTIRESNSSYSADASYLLDLARKNPNSNSLGPERFLHVPGDGHASLQRVDLKLFDSTPMSVTAFGFRKEVDRSYMSIASAQAKDEFATADQSGGTTGAEVRLGAISLTSSYGTYERTSDTATTARQDHTLAWDTAHLRKQLPGIGLGFLPSYGTYERTSDTPTTARQDHTLAWDTAHLRKQLPGIGLGFLQAFVPTSLSVTRFDSQTSAATDEQGVFERTGGYAANAAWNWSSGYGNASYWDYRLDSEQLGIPSYGFAGRGFDAGLGAYGTSLGVYSGFSYYRSDDVAPLYNSLSDGYHAYMMLSYKLDKLPDLSLNGSLSQYDYAATASSSSGTYWSVTLGFDFSKWLGQVDASAVTKSASTAAAGKSANSPDLGASRFDLKSPLGDKPSLKLFYRYATESTREVFSNHWSDSHLIAVALRGRL